MAQDSALSSLSKPALFRATKYSFYHMVYCNGFAISIVNLLVVNLFERIAEQAWKLAAETSVKLVLIMEI